MHHKNSEAYHTGGYEGSSGLEHAETLLPKGQIIHLAPPTTKKDTAIGRLLDVGDSKKYIWGKCFKPFLRGLGRF